MPDTLLFHVFILHNPWQMYVSIIYEKTETEWYRELSWDYKVRRVARIWTLFSLNPTFLSEAVYILSNTMPILILNPVKVQLCPRGNICGTSLICGQLPSQCGLKSCQNAPCTFHSIEKHSLCCCCCCRQVASVVSDSVRPHRRQPTRLPRPWDSPGKNTGVGCHFLLQCMKVRSGSEIAQSCPTLCNPMDRSPPGSSVHGIFPDTPSSACNCWILQDFWSSREPSHSSPPSL